MAGIQLPRKTKLSLDAARQIAAAAETLALEKGLRKLAVVIVDDGGYIVHALRMDGALPATVDVCLAKARAAAMLGRPTKFWRELVNGGQMWPVRMPFVVSAEGGLPLIVGGEVIGGLGVGGATGEEDRMVADAGLAVLEGAGS
jgi:glc operon protein GlcG